MGKFLHITPCTLTYNTLFNNTFYWLKLRSSGLCPRMRQPTSELAWMTARLLKLCFAWISIRVLKMELSWKHPHISIWSRSGNFKRKKTHLLNIFSCRTMGVILVFHNWPAQEPCPPVAVPSAEAGVPAESSRASGFLDGPAGSLPIPEGRVDVWKYVCMSKKWNEKASTQTYVHTDMFQCRDPRIFEF